MRNPNFPNHRFSGWPGAYCFYCQQSDPIEIHLASYPEDADSDDLGMLFTKCPATEEQKAKIDTWLDGCGNV